MIFYAVLGRAIRLPLAALLIVGGLQSGGAFAAPGPEAFEATAFLELTVSRELSCENTDDDIQDVIEVMAARGYSLREGQLKFWLPPDEPTENFSSKFLVNNFDIPFAERNSGYMVMVWDEDDEDAGVYTGGIVSPQDVVVIRMCTPSPPVTNTRISFNSFLVARETGIDQSGETTYSPLLRASLTDPLELEDLVVVPNDNSLFPEPYDRKINFVIGLDQQSLDDVTEAFVISDLLGTALNYHALPTSRFDFGPGPDGNPLTNNLRFFMKWDRLEDYHPDAYPIPRTSLLPKLYTQQSFPLYVFTRPGNYEAREPIPEQLLNPEPASDQLALARKYQKDFDQLVGEVIAHYEVQYGYTLLSDVPFSAEGANVDGLEVFNAEHGAYCMENAVDCQYDSYADAYWWDQDSHLLGEDDVYVIVGVDHAKLGMADAGSYLGMYRAAPDASRQVFSEVASWTPTQLASNSLTQELALTKPKLEELAKLSFLSLISRPQNCVNQGNFVRCPDVDELLPEDRIILRGRTSLNPATGTRPDDSQLIPWRLLHFSTAGDMGGNL